MKKKFSIHNIKVGESFPIKVQVSLSGEPSTMVYGKDKVPMTLNGNPFPRVLGEAILGDRAKGYFNAHLDGEGMLCIDQAIPDQDW